MDNGAWTLQTLALLALSCLWTLAYWRPRRKIWAAARLMPGPKPVPILGNALSYWVGRHKLLGELQRLRAEFGTVVRGWMGNRLMVMLSDPEDIQCVLGNPRVRDMDENAAKAMSAFTGNGLLSSSGEVWKMHKQLITPMFHFKVVESYVEVFGAKSSILMDKLDEVADGRTFDIYHQLSLYTLDSICETAIGQTTDTQALGVSALRDTIYDGSYLIMRRFLYPWLLIDWLYALTADGRRARQLVKVLEIFSSDMIARRLTAYRQGDRREGFTTASGKTITSFLDMLIEASETQGSILTEREIHDELINMALAGLETTSITMSALLVLIAIHPEWQDALHAETSHVFGGDVTRSATLEDLGQMPVLDRVMRETLRLYPSVAVMPRAIPEDIALPSGYTLPAGSSVMVINYIVHRDPKNFPEPDKFLPDRWLPGSDSERHAYAYLPFSAGPRNCVGQRYALLQMKSTLSQLVRRFKVTTDFTIEDMQKLHLTLTLRLNEDGYRVQLHKRGEA